MKTVAVNCSGCSIDFVVAERLKLRGLGKYCTKQCYWQSLKGKSMHPNTAKSLRKAHVGRKNTPETIEKMRDGAYKRLLVQGWNGTLNEYQAVHRWVYKNMGKPQRCDHCHILSAKKYEWANISQEYKYDETDWLRLCTQCHHKFDNTLEKQLTTKRERGLCV